MGKKKEDPPPAGSPAWMATFSDLMNLLLCFFVLLFSMSSVDAAKYDQVVASLSAAFSIMSSGGASITAGQLVSAGISQLPEFSNFFGDTLSDGANTEEGKGEEGTGREGDGDGGQQSDNDGGSQQQVASPGTAEAGQEGQQTDAGQQGESTGGEVDTQEAIDAYEQQEMNESEKMAEDIEKLTTQYGIQDLVEVDFNGQYVRITLNGGLLFDSGSAELAKDAKPLVEKVAKIVDLYESNTIEVEGHTDNVPTSASSRFESNDVLSMYRALDVADYIRQKSKVDPSHIVSSGRGAYVPIADNSTAEGRARNRRVEIKIYNSFNSDSAQEEK